MSMKKEYVCQSCGYKSPSFLGKCPGCSGWGSLVEENVYSDNLNPWHTKRKQSYKSTAKAVPLKAVGVLKNQRLTSGFSEADQVFGGVKSPGIVRGSVVLLAGEPGVGKSTLAMQILAHLGGLYVSGEESPQQVSLRSLRIEADLKKVFVLSETNLESIIGEAKRIHKEINALVVDSIQTAWTFELTGAPGSVGQIKECAIKLMDFAKKENLILFLIGHVTKEGLIAGPKILEHIVDTVVYLDGDRYQPVRILRTHKNRFGPVDEVGIFSLSEKGMNEAGDINRDLFKNDGQSGLCRVPVLEGSRVIFVEIQAIAVSSQLAIPRRIANGINPNRLQMLCAIMQKHLNLPLGGFDIFVNVTSGFKVSEPAADLGVILAVYSSFKGKSLPDKSCALGEVGLLGEVREVIAMEKRIREAGKLGFKKIFSAKSDRFIKSLLKEIR